MQKVNLWIFFVFFPRIIHSIVTYVYELKLQFLESNFVVMLFHYDGIVDEWKEFKWSGSVIHVSVDNQTKWYSRYCSIFISL